MKCPDCGAENAGEMTNCGSCGKPLRRNLSGGEGKEENRSQIEDRWDRVMSTPRFTEPVEPAAPGLVSSDRDFKLTSWVLIAALVLLVLGFALQVYANEKSEGLYDDLFSGDMTEMFGFFDDVQDISNVAKWAGYLQTIGLIFLAAGLVGLTVSLSKRL